MKKIKNKLASIGRYIDTNFYQIMMWFLIILNIAPILAPILAWLGLTPLAQIIYWVYSFFCHQLDWRSLHIADYQYAWCVRDTFIWLNILFAGFMARKYEIKPIKWYWLFIFIVPIALDGGIQTIATVFGIFNGSPDYISTNFTRMITGTIFGLGFGFWIMPSMWEAGNYTKQRIAFKWNFIKFLLLVFLANLLLYVLLVLVWDWTSPQFGPANLLDYVVRTPMNAEDWLVRRAHGL